MKVFYDVIIIFMNKKFIPKFVDPDRKIMNTNRIEVDIENGDLFDFSSGGDGDNGEHLMYILDIIFEEEKIKD